MTEKTNMLQICDKCGWASMSAATLSYLDGMNLIRAKVKPALKQTQINKIVMVINGICLPYYEGFRVEHIETAQLHGQVYFGLLYQLCRFLDQSKSDKMRPCRECDWAPNDCLILKQMIKFKQMKPKNNIIENPEILLKQMNRCNIDLNNLTQIMDTQKLWQQWWKDPRKYSSELLRYLHSLSDLFWQTTNLKKMFAKTQNVRYNILRLILAIKMRYDDHQFRINNNNVEFKAYRGIRGCCNVTICTTPDFHTSTVAPSNLKLTNPSNSQDIHVSMDNLILKNIWSNVCLCVQVKMFWFLCVFAFTSTNVLVFVCVGSTI